MIPHEIVGAEHLKSLSSVGRRCSSDEDLKAQTCQPESSLESKISMRILEEQKKTNEFLKILVINQKFLLEQFAKKE